jgi:hypothetical protein
MTYLRNRYNLRSPEKLKSPTHFFMRPLQPRMGFFCLPFFTCAKAADVKETVIPPTPALQIFEPESKGVCVPPAILNFSIHGNKSKFKKFCTENGLCIGCTYRHPNTPMFLYADGLNCPYCDKDSDPIPPSPNKKPKIKVQLQI